MQNILLYTDTPQTGGAEVQMFLLAKFLNKSNFTPILACSNYPQLDNWCQKFTQEGIKVIRFKVSHKHDPRHLSNLKRTIKQESIDLLHCHVWNPASCRYAFSLNTPTIITEHDPFKLSSIKSFFKKKSLKKVKKIITVSANNAKKIQNLYPEHSQKLQVILNGIDTTWWQSQLLGFSEEDATKIKEQVFHANTNSLIVTTIAELHERKGLKYLLKAVPKVIAEYPNLKFVIIGEGNERKSLEKIVEKLKIERNVALIGRKNNIPKLLKSSEIFLLPSRREAFGLVLTEAMITGLPVLASAVGGIPEIIQNGKNGILFESENPDAIAQTLLELIPSSEKRSVLGANGKALVLEKFDAKIMAEQYEKVYASILS